MLESIKQKGWLFILEGIILTLMGIIAISIPQIMTISISLVIAIMLLVTGIIEFYRAFVVKEEKEISWPFSLTGLLRILAGILMFKYLNIGAYVITILMILYFSFIGFSKIIVSIILKSIKYSKFLLISGVISICFALFIMIGLPTISEWLIGLLFGIHLLTSGFAMIALGIGVKKLA